jgi:tetratricopeptide (TPR) repeat protein
MGPAPARQRPGFMKESNDESAEPVYLERSFTELVEGETELAGIRRSYASKSRKERAQAADWNYHAAMASNLFNQALARAGQEGLGSTDWPEGYVALAIDPGYAPALLTVASIEYQLKRVPEAMKLFFRLLDLPKRTKDLTVIIDEAGDFLIGEKDLPNGRAFYAAACESFPRVPVFYCGLGYCCGKLGQLRESMVAHRRAVDLEPASHRWLNDLGFCLMEAKEYPEALTVLERAAALAPPNYELARNNLADLRKLLARRRHKQA